MAIRRTAEEAKSGYRGTVESVSLMVDAKVSVVGVGVGARVPRTGVGSAAVRSGFVLLV